MRRANVAGAVSLAVACAPTAPSAKPQPATIVVSAPSPPNPTSTATPAPEGSAKTRSATAPDAGGAFVRAAPSHEAAVGPDACAYLGGMGFACLNALLEEKDPVVRRYMRRMSDSDAREAFDELARGEPRGVAHAEVSLLCKEKGPCGGTINGVPADDGYACLTAAEMARQERRLAASRRAHGRACRCDPERGVIPVMGGFLACDGGTPVERGKILTTAEAADVRACAVCDPDKGPAACAREVQRLASRRAGGREAAGTRGAIYAISAWAWAQAARVPCRARRA